MKLRVSFKTPDALEYALEDTISEVDPEELGFDDLRVEEAEIEREEQIAEAKSVAERFINYGETVTIEIDTETGEARVIPLS